jgi:TonB-dependent SusC/RagA subfamily outer membrane receptor
MQKTWIFCIGRKLLINSKSTNWSLFMRVSTCVILNVLLVTNLLIAAPGNGQGNENTKINLTIEKVSLREALKTIERKADVVIMYEQTDQFLENFVSLNANNETVAQILNILLLDKNKKWKTLRGNIIRIDNASDTTATHSEALKYPAAIPSLTSPPVIGIVRGPDGQPLSGVNIIVKETKRGTTTNADGTFNIEANAGDIIILSSIGYADRQITIGNTNTVGEINLSVSESKLDEVQIIAYGETTRRNNVGNVTTINSKELSQQPVNNPLLALSGRVPGMTIQQTSGMPGAIPKIQIRGRNSLNFGSSIYLEPEPLYIVDGIPINSEIQGGPLSLGNGIGNASALSLVNIGDIESISILKDASQTSIYGSRGANGVILITTKQGKNGQAKLDVNL